MTSRLSSNIIYILEKSENFELRFDYSLVLLNHIRKIPKAWFDEKSGSWLIPKTHDRFVKEFAEYAKKRGLVNDVIILDSDDNIKSLADKMPDLSEPLKMLLEPYDYQRKGIQYMLTKKRTFNCDDMGLGKEQPYSEPILTPNGFVPMGTLRIGDKVIGQDGNPATITHIYEQGIKDVYEVQFCDSTTTRCGLDHLWNVITPNWKRRATGYKTLRLSEIMNNIYYEVTDKRDGKIRKSYTYSIPICKEVEFESKGDLPLDPYLLGVILGDGGLTNNTVTINKPNIELRERIKPIVEKYGDCLGEFKDGITYTIRRGKNKNSRVKEILGSLGLLGHLSKNKFIPEIYKYSSVESRKALLQGLIDTDGYIVKEDFIEYSTSSYCLKEDLSFIARSLGYMVRVKERMSYYEKRGELFPNFRVYLYAPTCRRNKTITDVKLVGRELSRCIAVDNEDHLYLTKDFIVTHNTMQTIGALSIAKAYPCLVVSPAAMKVTWQREFIKFIGKKAIILDDSNRNEWHKMFITGVCNIFITNYESLKKYFVLGNVGKRVTTRTLRMDRRISLFKAVIIDECHRCRVSNTFWSKYLEKICQGKEYIFMLTGTPMVTRIKDLVQQLRIMGRLDDFGGVRRFLSRYGGNNVSPVIMSELNYRLWQTCYFRRDKSLVLKELPEMVRQYRVIDITNRDEYESAEDDLRGYLQEYTECSDEKLRATLRSEAIVKIGILRRLSAEGKMQEAITTINDILDSGHKMIVFAAHKSVVAKIKSHFKDAVTVTGDDNQEKKQKSVDKFQNDPTCRLIILNIKSGGVGITLTAASTVLFVEFPWTAADCDQCECRAYRNGQKNVVNCTYLLGHHTFDEVMYDIINRERGESALVTGAKSNAEERIINNAIKSLKISI